MNAVLNMTDAKANFSEVVEQASHGQHIIPGVCKPAGPPVTNPSRQISALGFFRGNCGSPTTSTHGPKAGYSVLQIEIPHMTAYLVLPMHHRDPFDRLPVAQAQTSGFVLVTRDPEIAKYDVRTLLA